MKKYELMECDTREARYTLRCNGEIVLEEVVYDLGLEYVYQIIKPGDTYQEFHGPKDKFPVLSYERLMELKKQQEAFDRGEW